MNIYDGCFETTSNNGQLIWHLTENEFIQGPKPCRVAVECNIFITFTMVKYSQLFRALKKEGWYIVRQKGSHAVFRHPDKKVQLTIPFHVNKEVKRGLLTYILKQTGVNLKQR